MESTLLAELFDAMADGDYARVKAMLVANPDIHSLRTKSNETALHVAVRSATIRAIKLLIAHGADVNATGGIYNLPPIFDAASVARPDVVRLLVEHGTDIRVESEFGESLVSRLVVPICTRWRVSKADETLDYLLSLGLDINHQDKFGNTILHNASMYESYVGVKSLIDRGSDTNAKDINGRIPLHNAAQLARNRIILVLLENGSDVNAKTNAGHTPMDCALAGYRMRTALLLHNSGGLATFTNDLLLAILNGQTRQAKAILADNRGLATSANEGARSPLHWAAAIGNLSVMRALLSLNPKADVLDHAKNTPLHAAVINGERKAAKLLIERGCDVNSYGDMGKTPLHIAARRHLGIVELLLANGADPNRFDKFEHYKPYSHNPAITELLIKHGQT